MDFLHIPRYFLLTRAAFFKRLDHPMRVFTRLVLVELFLALQVGYLDLERDDAFRQVRLVISVISCQFALK